MRASKRRGRRRVRALAFDFTNGFHGMTLGSLAVTGNAFKRQGAGVALHHTIVIPYCNYLDEEPKLPTPMIEPEKVADAILEAATSPKREVKVGAMALLSQIG